MNLLDDYLAMPVPSIDRQTRVCNCIGPQGRNPVCPCQMLEHNRRRLADAALDLFTRCKPRVRVKAGRREVAL